MDSLPDKFRIHPVKFEGYWKELPESSSCNDYGDHRDEGGIVDNWYMRKFVNIVENYPKDNPSIVDFGGGGGKVFDTLSAIAKKAFHIQSSTLLTKEVRRKYRVPISHKRLRQEF